MANAREELLELQKQVAAQELAKIAMEMDFLQKEDIRKEEGHKLRMACLKKEYEKDNIMYFK